MLVNFVFSLRLFRSLTRCLVLIETFGLILLIIIVFLFHAFLLSSRALHPQLCSTPGYLAPALYDPHLPASLVHPSPQHIEKVEETPEAWYPKTGIPEMAMGWGSDLLQSEATFMSLDAAVMLVPRGMLTI
ncbi:hypothetical protein ACJZ2D_007095 [Fusarium nematophilum]